MCPEKSSWNDPGNWAVQLTSNISWGESRDLYKLYPYAQVYTWEYRMETHTNTFSASCNPHPIDWHCWHYIGVIMSAMASQITSVSIVYSTVCSGTDQRKQRSSPSTKLRITGLCEGNSPVTGETPVQWVSNAENVSIWLRHHELRLGKVITSRVFYGM